MAETIVLEANRRQVIGKHVRRLRRDGVVPGVLYGPEFESLPVQMDEGALRAMLLEAGGSQIIQLKVEGETYNALVRGVQRAPIRGDLLHVDFYRVRMDVKIRTEVPVVLVGDVDAFEKIGGVIIHEMNSVEVECLPGDLPAEIPVEIVSLKEIGDMILASDLPKLPGVTYHNIEPNEVIVTTSYLQRLEVEEEAEAAPEEEEPELIRRRPAEEEEEEV
jgi:large subunit ribosomal protein L25